MGELTQGQRLEIEVLQALVDAVATARRDAGLFGQPNPPGADVALERAVQTLLASAINTPSAPPALWGAVAIFNGALGYPDSVRDALKRQVCWLLCFAILSQSNAGDKDPCLQLRGLAATAWRQEEESYVTYARCVLANCSFLLDHPSGGAARDLSAGRMQLQALLKAVRMACHIGVCQHLDAQRLHGLQDISSALPVRAEVEEMLQSV